MSYTDRETPLAFFIGEQAIPNAIRLAKYQWPALFNFASEAFFQSEWFLKKMAGQPYFPRLVVPISTSPVVLEAAATDPHYLAYPLPDLPLPDWNGQDPNGPTDKPIPICAQVDDVQIDFDPLTSELPPDWKPEEGQFFARLLGHLGMLAESPGLPAIPEQPVLLLSFPFEIKALVSAGFLRGDDGESRLEVVLANLDPPALEPLALKEMLASLAELTAEHYLPAALANIEYPIEIAACRLSTYPADPAEPYQITFAQPVNMTVNLDTREHDLPNPEMKEDRLGVFFELDLTREVTP